MSALLRADLLVLVVLWNYGLLGLSIAVDTYKPSVPANLAWSCSDCLRLRKSINLARAEQNLVDAS
jgi:hypothetical protein